MSEEEKKAIKIVDNLKIYYNTYDLLSDEEIEENEETNKSIDIVLNLITRLQKENEKKDEEIKELKENIDYQVLCDFLISSVPNEEPIWTEKHIEELLENFEMRWKNAYK